MLNAGVIAKTKRIACGLSQAELAEKANISTATLSKFENGLSIGDDSEKVINDCLSDIYRTLTTGEQFRVRLKSLSLQLDSASATEAAEIAIRMIELTSRMLWYLNHR